ncbi:MAG: TlpA family protein disulfide reductase [Planctomycetes bacterium]|nr:TlpA family protein disulfide reductase [Planctomycetota bacterium]
MLLTFWAADSKASIGQVECPNALHEKRYPEGLVVVGVTSDENKEVTKFIAAQKVTYPIAIGWNQAWAVRMIPSALLIDPDGKVLWTGLPTELDELTLPGTGQRPAGDLRQGPGGCGQEARGQRLWRRVCRVQEAAD